MGKSGRKQGIEVKGVMSKMNSVTIDLEPELFHELRKVKKARGWTWRACLIEALKEKK